MSGLRDNLEEWALSHGAQVATGLSEHEPQAREKIRSRRRNRAFATAATAAAAIVGIVAVASAVPNLRGPEPASNAFVTPQQLECGQPWNLEQGTTTYFPDAAAYFGGVGGEWVSMTVDGDRTANPSELDASSAVLWWEGSVALAGNTIVQSTVVAVKDGNIVGATDPEDQAFDGTTLVSYSALPGTCGSTTTPMDSGEYTYHVVVWIEQMQNQERPVAMVVDPNGPLTLEVNKLTEWSAPRVEPPSGLVEPQGELHQAFAVRRPTPTSCTPYQDMIDAGEPLSRSHLEYNVIIPGVQPITGDAWSNAPVAIIDDPTYRAWYIDLPTAIVAENFDGGDPLGSLAWTSGAAIGGESHPDQLRLVNADGAGIHLPNAPGCAFILPVPSVSGAVFLIIDGVDAAALSAANPGADFTTEGMQTWVYLGQAS